MRTYLSLLLVPAFLFACSSTDDSDADSAGDADGGVTPATGGLNGTGGSAPAVGGTGSGGVASGGGSATGGTDGGTTPSGPLTMGYILDMYTAGIAGLDQLDYTATDYVIHAFYTGNSTTGALEGVNETVADYRNAGLVTKVHAAGSKIVMSLGGANHSFSLKQIAASPSLTATFVADVVAKINEWGYDGVDLDLEFPAGGNEPQEHLALMTALHNAIKANNPEHLTMFGISPGYYIDQFLWSELSKVSDYGFYFCYDWDGPGIGPANGPIRNPGVEFTAFGGAKFEASCQGAMNYMIAEGYPASQIIVGLPFYANGGAHYRTASAGVKSAIPDANYMEVEDPSLAGAWWTNVAAMEMKVDAVLTPGGSVLTDGAAAAGVGWWEWGYEDPAAPELSQAIKARVGK